jgi:hypothetical protein
MVYASLPVPVYDTTVPLPASVVANAVPTVPNAITVASSKLIGFFILWSLLFLKCFCFYIKLICGISLISVFRVALPGFFQPGSADISVASIPFEAVVYLL